MLTPEILFITIAILGFGLLFTVTALRLQTKETVVLHLLLFVALGLAYTLFRLTVLLNFSPLPAATNNLLSDLLLVASVLAFGTLTFVFLHLKKAIIAGYWGLKIVLLALGVVISFGFIADFPLGQNVSNTFALTLAGWIIPLVAIFAALFVDFRKRQAVKHLNRLRYWLIATTLWSVSGLIYFVSPPIFYWSGLLLLLAGSILASYTVLNYHTPDLNLLVGRTVRYVIITGILAVPFYLGLVVTIIVAQSPLNRINIFFWSVILAVVLAIVIQPLWKFSTRLFTRIIFGKQQADQRKVIKNYSQRVSNVLDIQRLGDTIIELMIETLGIERGVIFINQRGEGGQVSLQPLSSTGMTDLTTGHFTADSLFLNHFRQGHKLLHQYDIDVLPEFSALRQQERDWLAALGMELYIPILRNRDFAGMLAFGPQPHGTAYYDEDLDLMAALADQAALALDSARLFEQLAIINKEVGQLSDKLAGLDQTKTDFLSIASHELRTPLTHIHGYSRMLLDLTEEELQDEAYVKSIIEGIAKGSDRMKGVIDVMFDVTEAHIGDMNLFLGPVNLNEVIDQATRPFIKALDERRIAFGKTGFEELPIIEADGTRLVQAFENLISNAIKYTPDGGVITIESKPVITDDLGSAVEIVITDTGIGIDPQYHQQIFEKFFRIDDTDHHSSGKTKFKGGGPGLGLTLVKAIADVHDGKVWVESKGENETTYPGSKFFFAIPLHSRDKPKKERPKQSEIETVHWRTKDLKPAK